MIKTLLALALLVAAATPSFGVVQDAQDIVVLVVSSSRSFDAALEPLRFAGRDGSRFADIMTTAGRVPKDHVVFLNDASMDQVPASIERVNKILASCPTCTNKFLFYYSGHADENGLHFRDGLFGKNQLHDTLNSVHAQTKIVMLDSCFSGALSQKGVSHAPTFELPKAEYDEPSGSIFISASSGREFSYESKDLGGSVFTYHLVAGLSGEADSTGDGVVTVDELYQYVYRETKLHSLLFPSASTQTPEFVSRLEGRGAIALSFPAETNSRLLLSSDVAGQITLAARDGIRIFKVDKALGVRKNLQLPPGRYAVSVNQGSRVGNGQLELETKKLALLTGENLTWQDRGGPGMTRKGASASASDLQFAAAAGVHKGFTPDQRAGAELAMEASAPLGGGHGALWSLRSGGRLSGDMHETHAAADWSNDQIVRLQGGVTLELRNPYTTLPQTLLFTPRLGVAYESQSWHYADRPARGFHSTMPAYSLALGYGVRWPETPFRWVIEARRDFQVARDARTGSRTLGGNALAIGLQF